MPKPTPPRLRRGQPRARGGDRTPSAGAVPPRPRTLRRMNGCRTRKITPPLHRARSGPFVRQEADRTTTPTRPPASSTTPSRGVQMPTRVPSCVGWRGAPALAGAPPEPAQHRCLERPCRGRQPVDQAGQALGPRVPLPGQVPAPHPPRRRHQPHARNSTGHEHPTPTSQVGPVGPLTDRQGSDLPRLIDLAVQLASVGVVAHQDGDDGADRPVELAVTSSVEPALGPVQAASRRDRANAGGTGECLLVATPPASSSSGRARIEGREVRRPRSHRGSAGSDRVRDAFVIERTTTSPAHDVAPRALRNWYR